MFDQLKKYLVDDYKDSNLDSDVLGGVGLFLICSILFFGILFIETKPQDSTDKAYLSQIPNSQIQNVAQTETIPRSEAVLGESDVQVDDYDQWLYSGVDKIIDEFRISDQEATTVTKSPEYTYSGSDRSYTQEFSLSNGQTLSVSCPNFEGSYTEILADKCAVTFNNQPLDEVRRNLGESGAKIHLTIYDDKSLSDPVMVVGKFTVGSADDLYVWKLSEQPEIQYFFDKTQVVDRWFGLFDNAIYVDSTGAPYLVTMYHNPSMSETMLYRLWDMEMEYNNLILRESVLEK